MIDSDYVGVGGIGPFVTGYPDYTRYRTAFLLEVLSAVVAGLILYFIIRKAR